MGFFPDWIELFVIFYLPTSWMDKTTVEEQTASNGLLFEYSILFLNTIFIFMVFLYFSELKHHLHLHPLQFHSEEYSWNQMNFVACKGAQNASLSPLGRVRKQKMYVLLSEMVETKGSTETFFFFLLFFVIFFFF